MIQVFKQSQKEDEFATEYMGQLRGLGRTCHFGMYLEMALRDQFVCSLSDAKCQRELLCDTALTAETALKKARASEVVLKETEGMQAVKELGNVTIYHDCSNQCKQKYHHGVLPMWRVRPQCISKAIRCHACQKIGHIARVCHSKNKSEATKKTSQQRSSKLQDVHHLYDQNQDDSSVNIVEEYLHSVFQLGDSSRQFIVTVVINEVNLYMEAD